MTAETSLAKSRKTYEVTSPTRRIVIGALFILVAVLIYVTMAIKVDPLADTTFGLNVDDKIIRIPDLVFNSRMALYLVTGIFAGVGLYEIIRGFKKRTNSVIGLMGALFVIGFLAWGASGGSINMTGLLSVMVIRAVPITIGALAGLMCERAGIVNIAIEGMMIAGAFAGAILGSLYGLWVAMLGAILVGALLALVHGVLSIKYKVNQIISGTMINIFSTGLTSYLFKKFLQVPEYQHLNQSGFFKPLAVPLLSKIPILGPIFFNHNIYVYLMYILVALITVALFKTRWGLRHRAVGEHPKTADTLGINVFRTRYMAVLMGGMLAGLGGSYFSLGSVGRFEQTMTAGRGFIALAAMIFGNWTPVGSFQAGLLFGFAESLATKLSIIKIPIPAEILLMVPYVITMVVLAGVVGRSRMPAADGVPYEKESL